MTREEIYDGLRRVALRDNVPLHKCRRCVHAEVAPTDPPHAATVRLYGENMCKEHAMDELRDG